MDFKVDRPRLALSVRQPHVEAILRGIKECEYRRMRTSLRERIYIYASRTRYSIEEERFWLAEYGFDQDPQFQMENLIFGKLTAIVSITGCEPCTRYGATWAWRLSNAVRLEPPLRPAGSPQPVFFKPFPE